MPKSSSIRMPGLILALVMSPALAGLIGGLLVFLGTLPIIFGPHQSSAGDSSLVGGVLATSVIAMVFGMIVTYAVAVPFILGGWAAAHFLTTRKRSDFLFCLTLTGAFFAYVLFGGFLRQVDQSNAIPGLFYALAPLLSGAIAGLIVGAMIHSFGYQQGPDSRADSV